MQQVGFYGVGRGAKQSDITIVEVPFAGSVEDAWRYVLRFCKETYNWPDTIALGGGLDRTEDGKRIYIVGQRPATDDERRARGIPDNSAEKVTTEDGGVVGSIEIVRINPHRANLICKSVGADCRRFMAALVQKIERQNYNAGDVLRRGPMASDRQAEPQADSGAVTEEELSQAAEKGWREATPDIVARARASSRTPPRPPVRGDDAVDAVVEALWAEANLDTEANWILKEYERSEDAPIAYEFERHEEGETAVYTIYLDDKVAGRILVAPDEWTRLRWRWLQRPVAEDPLLGSNFNILCWWIKTRIELRFGNLVKWEVLEQELSEEQAESPADSGVVAEKTALPKWFPKGEDTRRIWKRAYHEAILPLRKKYLNLFNEGETDNPKPTIGDHRDKIANVTGQVYRGESTIRRIQKAGDEGWLAEVE